MIRTHAAAVVLAFAALSSPHARAATAATIIAPDTLPGRTLGTTVSVSGAVTTIDGGAVAGANLFESFSAFSLAAGDTARWVYTGSAISPTNIANVISRVTGGVPSQINGVLDSTALPNANFYFINPAGIVFGAGAQVNVPAAAYFSTASEVRFGAGQTAFSATNPGSTLAMASPASFGFLGGEGDLTVDGVDSSFFSGAGKLSLSAANLAISNVAAASPILAGGLDLAAVGNESFDLPLGDAVPLNAAMSGTLAVQNATLERTPSASLDAELQIRAGAMTIEDGAILSRVENQGQASVRGDITIGVSSLLLDDAAIASDTATDVGGGYITIASDSITLQNGSNLSAQSCGASCFGTGNGGAIVLEGRTSPGSLALSIVATSAISTDTNGPGNAGQITITAASVNNQGSISSAGEAADAGAAGVITISDGEGTGRLTNSGVISTDTDNGYNAGTITITMHGVVDEGTISSSALAGATGQSGSIQLNVGTLEVLQGGAIETNSSNASPAGSIYIIAEGGAPSLTTPAILIDGQSVQGRVSQISSLNTYAGSCGSEAYCGDAGSIGVNANFNTDPPTPLPTAADGLTLSNGGQITTNSKSGSAGDIALNIAPGSLLTLEGKTNVGLITTSSISDTPGMVYILGGSGIVLNGADIQALGPYPDAASLVIITSQARVLSSDRPNIIQTTGVLELDSPEVNVSGATTLLDLTFVDAGKVLQGQCGALAASGETSQLIDQVKGPYGEALDPSAGGGEASPPPPSSGCGNALSRH